MGTVYETEIKRLHEPPYKTAQNAEYNIKSPSTALRGDERGEGSLLKLLRNGDGEEGSSFI